MHHVDKSAKNEGFEGQKVGGEGRNRTCEYWNDRISDIGNQWRRVFWDKIDNAESVGPKEPRL